MRHYEGWTFRDRSFLIAVGISILWHLFWFVSVTITVKQPPKEPKHRTRVVSLGPVLDDSIFRTLVAARPEASQAFYRRLSDYSAPVVSEAPAAAPHGPGAVVSLPFGKRLLESVRGLVAGVTNSPDDELFKPLSKSLADEERRRREEAERRLGLASGDAGGGDVQN